MDVRPENPVVERLLKVAVPEVPLTPAAALRAALELADAGTDMMRMNLRRRHPHASVTEVEEMLREWLHSRPGAEHGDSWGRPAPERLARL